MEIFVYLDRTISELERSVSADVLALGCTPIVNLFSQRCEPIQLTHMETEYRVVPDSRRPATTEVWQIEKVRETHSDGSSRPWRPFYRLTHGDPDGDIAGAFYYPVRRQTAGPLTGARFISLRTILISIPTATTGGVLSVDAVCLNRDLPADLPFGGGHPELRFVEPTAGVTRVSCLTAPSLPLRPPLREQRFWRLVSHLSLGHLSVVGGEEAATALREVLRLYDLRDFTETRAAIDALISVTSKPGSARAPGGKGRLLPRARRDTRIRTQRLGNVRALPDGLGSRPLSRTACDGQFFRADACGIAGPHRTRPRLAGASRHARFALAAHELTR